MTFAAKTQVPVSRTRQGIEAALRKAGATRIITMDEPAETVVAFQLEGRMVRMTGPVAPDVSDQVRRTLWRNIDQVVRGKLAGVDMGIETAEEAFLAHIVMPNGQTVYEAARGTLAVAYETGNMPALLPAPSKGSA